MTVDLTLSEHHFYLCAFQLRTVSQSCLAFLLLPTFDLLLPVLSFLPKQTVWTPWQRISLIKHLRFQNVRGALLTKGPDSSVAEAHRGFNSEPIHMEDEVKDQEDEVEDGRDK